MRRREWCWVLVLGVNACAAMAYADDASTNLRASRAAESDGEPSAGVEPGSDDDLPEYHFEAGGDVGYTSLDARNYLALTPGADLRLSILQASIRVPLRVDVANDWAIRERDWDETSDFFRLGQCVRLDWSSIGTFRRERGQCRPWDVSKDDYYVSARLAPVQDLSLGHGTILNGFSNNINPDHFQSAAVTSFQLHQFVTGKFLVDNVTAPSVLGGVMTFQPFAYEAEANAEYFEESSYFRLQTTAVSDLRAPDRVLTAFGRALADEHGNFLYTTAPVTVLGADAQYRYAFGDQIQFEARADWNYIVEHGMGVHAQALFIYNHPDGIFSWKGTGEFRAVQHDYLPNYFDAYYFIQRQQFNLTNNTGVSTAGSPIVTKAQLLDQLSAQSRDWNMGYYLALEGAIFTGEADTRRVLAEGRLFVADNIGRSADGQLLASLGLRRLGGAIDVTALYSRMNWNKVADLLQLNNTLIKLLVRWDLGDLLYATLSYGRVWQLRNVADEQASYRSTNEFNIGLGLSENVL